MSKEYLLPFLCEAILIISFSFLVLTQNPETHSVLQKVIRKRKLRYTASYGIRALIQVDKEGSKAFNEEGEFMVKVALLKREWMINAIFPSGKVFVVFVNIINGKIEIRYPNGSIVRYSPLDCKGEIGIEIEIYNYRLEGILPLVKKRREWNEVIDKVVEMKRILGNVSNTTLIGERKTLYDKTAHITANRVFIIRKKEIILDRSIGLEELSYVDCPRVYIDLIEWRERVTPTKYVVLFLEFNAGTGMITAEVGEAYPLIIRWRANF